jgi:hypothetical protein
MWSCSARTRAACARAMLVSGPRVRLLFAGAGWMLHPDATLKQGMRAGALAQPSPDETRSRLEPSRRPYSRRSAGEVAWCWWTSPPKSLSVSSVYCLWVERQWACPHDCHHFAPVTCVPNKLAKHSPKRRDGAPSTTPTSQARAAGRSLVKLVLL